MKRILALLLAALMTAGSCIAMAEDAGNPGAPEHPAVSHLTVGNPTPMRGDFFTEMWGNATSDIDVRDLLHGYGLVSWNGNDGMFAVDASAVSGILVTADAEGNKSYTLSLRDDLVYSDGSPITAWDYAFTWLLTMAPEIGQIGGTPLRREYLLGSTEYQKGEVPYLAGVRVLADHLLRVTLDHRYLPFFYEMGLLMCNPYPIAVIAPGVMVKDDGQGVYLANADPGVKGKIFTAELLWETILNPETGYRSHPSVVSGPYTLVSWDGVTAEFARNPLYRGNRDGDKAEIETLTYTTAENGTMVQKLEDGEFGLLNKVTRADQITAGMALMQQGNTGMSNYPRLGLSYVSFAGEKPTVSSQAVRQAIAWCMDRDGITQEYTGGFGLRVDGYYGIGQWMTGIIQGTTEPPVSAPEDGAGAAEQAAYEQQMAAFEELNLDGLTVYGAEPARAVRLLEEDGWTLNAAGVREKDGVTLELKMIYPEGNSIDQLMERYLVPNLNVAGIRLTMEAVPMGELLGQWYQEEAREADMIYLATDFDIVFDPSAHFRQGEDGGHSWSWTNVFDEALYAEAAAMRQTEPGNVLGYMEHWVAFQERFNEVLPMIPVYSNIYFDFYTDQLQGYRIAENVTWGEAVLGAWIGEDAAEEMDEDLAEDMFIDE